MGPHRTFGVGPIRGIGVIMVEEGETPIWDPIGLLGLALLGTFGGRGETP